MKFSYFSVLVSATCNPPNSYFKQYTDRYYVSTLGVYNKHFNDAIISCTITGSRLAIISDKNSHDAVYANRGIQNTAKIYIIFSKNNLLSNCHNFNALEMITNSKIFN
jgi:hypothetical protein